jgi:hypothetical protein
MRRRNLRAFGLLFLGSWDSNIEFVTLSLRNHLCYIRIATHVKKLIHARLDLIHNSARSHPHSATSHPQSARSHPFTIVEIFIG